MQASTLMTHDPVSVGPKDLIYDAAARMAQLGIGMLPVVETSNGGGLIGVITDRDIVCRCTAKRHDPSSCTVKDHMTTSDLATVDERADHDVVAATMARQQIRRIPVVNAAGRLVGVISQADIARQVGPMDPQLVEEVLERVSAPV